MGFRHGVAERCGRNSVERVRYQRGMKRGGKLIHLKGAR